MPAWRLIESVGLRGHRVGDVYVSTKHANFFVHEPATDKAAADKAVAPGADLRALIAEAKARVGARHGDTYAMEEEICIVDHA